MLKKKKSDDLFSDIDEMDPELDASKKVAAEKNDLSEDTESLEERRELEQKNDWLEDEEEI